jgi:hypothetical protein
MGEVQLGHRMVRANASIINDVLLTASQPSDQYQRRRQKDRVHTLDDMHTDCTIF